MGVMVPLLSKLIESTEQPRFKDLKNDLKSLRAELASMEAVMLKFATQDDTDLQVKEWMRQVREVGYDTDDWIDSHPPVAAETKGSRLASGFFSRNNRRRKLAELIKELKDRVEDASGRRTRYMLQSAPVVDDVTDDLRHSNVTVDPQLLYGVSGRLVGLDEPMEELVRELRHGGGEQQHFKVVSIVGGGGARPRSPRRCTERSTANLSLVHSSLSARTRIFRRFCSTCSASSTPCSRKGMTLSNRWMNPQSSARSGSSSTKRGTYCFRRRLF